MGNMLCSWDSPDEEVRRLRPDWEKYKLVCDLDAERLAAVTKDGQKLLLNSVGAQLEYSRRMSPMKVRRL